MAESVDDFVAGIVGGVAGLVVGHPFDVIKVRQQTHHGQYSIGRAAVDLVQKEGVRSLFRGIGPPVFGVGGLNAVLFGTYGLAARMLTGKPHARDELTLGQSYVAGTVAGIACCTITAPTELLKCRAQAATVAKSLPHKAGQSPASTLYQMRAVIRDFGVLGLFKGWWVTVLRDAPSFGVYFITYESLKRRLTNGDPDPDTVLTVSTDIRLICHYGETRE
ncbi:hypothetical protein PTSG_10305 [Salpingoeca rosetta]|uniref:Uncharacterized protein n=1 Tax=Salpingoeca rosetta (strain ATCC 50818 / BSB-021) TaxID=946362 RepID=F2UQX5_SALR5|nr:uncharacterized protein PTSG_10305 [Salpingoeca rosetta]EGD80030.1 hypothetical protein PTSG_10305 [Salpingoeca rosetta]|eukprot:XP_004988355.1 hypothetical protein PTSG_10305 [Salpingoeca rosetta]